MQAEQRIEMIVEAVNRLKAGKYDDAGIVILSDAACGENYVQFWKHAPGTASFEVSSRDYEGVTLPVVSADQGAALGALGFKLYPCPNYQQDISLSDPWTIARMSEQAFMILGCASDFDLAIEYGDLGDD